MLINLRNALMAGKRLPYDAEVEYLESTGTQWINTGVVATNNTRVKIAFSDYTQAGAWLFGARRAYKNSALGVYTDAGSANNSWRRTFGNFISENFTFSTVDLGVSTFDYDCGHFTGTREKVPITVDFTDTASAFDSSPYNIYLWTVNLAGTAGNVSSAKMYATQIWQNGVLVRDLIPVRRGTVGYLYDRVSGKLFGNAGTGDFVLGSDVVPVEYIESHGTEYINTGIILNDTYGIDINFAPMETASGVSEHGIFGSSVSGSGIRHNVLQIHQSANGVGLWMPSNTRICTYAITIGEFQHWQINLNDSDNVVIDNVLKAHTHPTTPAECQYPVYLFGRNVANTLKSGSCSKMRLATWMVCDGSGNIIQKWLPVRVGTEGAMMDVLTRRIYRNAGTGAFAYGNDLKYPIPAE